MGMVNEDTYHPPEPSQFGAVSAAHLLRRGEFTGMLFCPWKRGQIAVQRCEEYRLVCGLAESCAAKPGEGELAAVREAMAQVGATESLSKRGGGGKLKAPNYYYQRVIEGQIYGICQTCGETPAAYRKTGECMSCYSRRRYGHKKIERRPAGKCKNGCNAAPAYKGTAVCLACVQRRYRERKAAKSNAA